MSEKKLGQEPAFPIIDKDYGNSGIYETGVSKRLYIATQLLQGLLANPDESLLDTQMSMLVNRSYEIADELLEQGNL